MTVIHSSHRTSTWIKLPLGQIVLRVCEKIHYHANKAFAVNADGRQGLLERPVDIRCPFISAMGSICSIAKETNSRGEHSAIESSPLFDSRSKSDSIILESVLALRSAMSNARRSASSSHAHFAF